MSYETLIFYSVVTSVITLDRVSLKKRVVDAPEILTVIDSIPHLTSYLNSLHGCQYGSFFKARFFYCHASMFIHAGQKHKACMHCIVLRVTAVVQLCECIMS